MPGILKFFTDTSLGFALMVAVFFYGTIRFIFNLANEDAKKSFSLIVMGDFKHWELGFVSFFDAIFGEKHLSWRCVAYSTIASIITVIVLYHFLANVWGIIGLEGRTGSAFGWVTLASLIIINIIADYISLFQTRWTLQQCGKMNNMLMHIVILLLDILLSAFIIYLVLNFYLISTGEGWMSYAKLIGAYNNYTIFFYSTFFTSLIAWLYILSALVIRIVYKLSKKILFLDLENKADILFTFILSFFIFMGVLLAYPAMEKISESGVVDRFFCTVSADTCWDVHRISKNEEQKLSSLLAHCSGMKKASPCLQEAIKIYKLTPKKAVLLFEASCDGDSMLGCYNLGVIYHKGEGEMNDLSKAERFYAQACEGGYMRACTNLGTVYHSEGVMKGLSKAERLYTRACEAGELGACYNLGVIYHEGEGVMKDLSKAEQLYTRACEGGTISACYNLGNIYHREGVMKDLSKAERLYTHACEAGELGACNNLGAIYYKGEGATKDLSKAERLYTQACDGGKMPACISLGNIYQNGEGVMKDLSKAERLYTQACDGGYMRACSNLGNIYHSEGATKDLSKAERFYAQACEGDIMYACYKLGVIYHKGEGVMKDLSKAEQLYTRACESDEMKACTKLSLMYYKDEDIPKDIIEVERYKQACYSGEVDACLNLTFPF